MISPWREWAGLIEILAVGSLLLLAGFVVARRYPSWAKLAIFLVTLLAITSGAAHYQPLRPLLGERMSSAGGEGVVACLALLALIGLAVGMGKQIRPWLVALSAAICLTVLLVLSGAPLYWRYLGAQLRDNFPNKEGRLQQTSGITCAAAAGATLAAANGIRVSEGAIAELAGTNPLIGTDEFALARALGRLANGRLQGRAEHLGWSPAARLRRPFVAYIRRPGIGGHAILVSRMGGDTVLTIDPLTGNEDEVPRLEFEDQWTGVAVWLQP